MQKWTYPSKSGGKPHTTTLADDGLLSCICKGYYIKRPNKPKMCSHIEDVVKRLGLNIVQRGDLVYANGEAGPVQANVAARLEQRDESTLKNREEQADANGYVNPMLADAMTKRDPNEPWDVSLAPYQNGKWLAGIKYDGERIILSKTPNGVFFWSRPRLGEGRVGLENQKVGSHIREAAKYLPDGTYDGELIAGENGKSYDVTNLANRANQSLVLFDMLRLDSTSLLKQPLTIRLALLEKTISTVYPGEGHCIKLAQSVQPTAENLQALFDAGAEGLVLKRADSIYSPGARNGDWVKVKREFYTVGVIIGFSWRDRPKEKSKAKNGPYSKVILKSVDGIETTVKTKDNKWLAEFEKNGDAYLGKSLVFKHYGPTPDGKYRGPIIWDHWASKSEIDRGLAHA